MRAELIMKDNGRGFYLESLNAQGLGLSMMYERARTAGAKLNIDSHIGKGTQTSISWQQLHIEENNGN
jgi:signal transduction histidine kinase